MSVDAVNMQILLTLFAIALIPTLSAIAYLRIKNKVLLATVGFGALAWLIALIRSPILQATYWYVGQPSIPPVWFIGFSAILAGVFEESFRYLFMKRCVKGRGWYDGLAFGLGVGLLEIILIYCIPILMTMILAPNSITSLEALAGAVERNFAVCIHVSCALLIMHSLRNRWMLGAAILYHFLVDFVAVVAAYYSTLTLWQVESIVSIFALISLVIVYLEKQILSRIIWEKIQIKKKRASLIADFLGAGLRYHKFVCPHCENVVEISLLRRAVALTHMPRSHYLKCSGCGKRSWMKVDEKSYPELK